MIWFNDGKYLGGTVMSLTSTKKKDNNIVELEIAVTADELAKAVEKVFRRKAKNITVPGFRKGKAPKQIIEKMYGEGVFLEDAVNDIYPSAYTQAVEEADIEPVDKAEVEILDMDKGNGFTFKATVTVKPEVSVKDYKGIKAEKKITKISDAVIDEEIEKMRERNARIISVEDRPAVNGDTAIIDFDGFVDDVPFDGGKGEDFNLVLGSGSFIDTFEQQIEGHSVGEEFDVNVTFPEEYHVEELKGKPALFKVKLKELKGKELPELDDEFVKDVSEFNTVDELRKDMREKMQEQNDQRAGNDLENDLIDEVIKNLEGDIPACMYENKIDDMVRDFEYRLSSQGMNMQLYLQYSGMDKESFRETFREQSERQVKIRLALEKIAELENIQILEEEIEAEYTKLAESYKMDVEKVKGFITGKDISADLRTGKAVDLVRDSADVTEVEAGEEENSENPKETKEKGKAADDNEPAPKKALAKKSALKTEEE